MRGPTSSSAPSEPHRRRATQRGERLAHRCETGIQAVGVVRADSDDEVVGAGLVGHLEAHAAQHVDVELGRHRHLRGGDAGSRPTARETCMRLTESW